LLDPYFALQVMCADGKCQPLVLFTALFLKGCGGPDGGIKGDV